MQTENLNISYSFKMKYRLAFESSLGKNCIMSQAVRVSKIKPLFKAFPSHVHPSTHPPTVTKSLYRKL